MPLPSGKHLGPYEILDLLGAGGMGEVYRARDTRLDRTVAIKVLPAHLAENLESKQRFEREARAVAALNHPHICALYDVGQQDDKQECLSYLVMEYLDGETLGARLARASLPIELVLEYAIQMTDALAQAHKQGVFHRDLKPGNVMIVKTGTKLLDFGLAKLKESAAPPGMTTFTALPTEGLTQKGTILGTFQYMAPEQVEGKETDARADIFSFGAVLYEMATGKKAFEGRTAASALAAVLEREPPPVSSLQPVAPRGLDRAVRRCLAKDPDDRWQSARDLHAELKWIVEAPAAAPPPVPSPAPAPVIAPPKAAGRLVPWSAAAVSLLAAVTLGVLHFREVPPPRTTLRFQVAPPEKSAVHTFALSPDARYLALAAIRDGKRSLWVRALNTLEAQALPGTEDATYPFWSPDSRFIGFFAQRKLKKVAVTGGPPQSLCDAPDGRGGSWNREGMILFSPNPNAGIHRVSAAGGVSAAHISLGGGLYRFPAFLAGGRHFLYVVSRSDSEKNGVHVASLDSRDARLLLSDQSSAAFAAGLTDRSGHLLFVRENTLVAQPFDAARLQTTGELFPIAERIGFTNLAYGDFSVSAAGTLAYISGRAGDQTQLLWYDRTGKQLGAAVAPGFHSNLALSPDEKRVAMERSDRGAQANIWLAELGRGTDSRFTFEARNDYSPVWSPDGSRIAFAAAGNPTRILGKSSSGAGKEEELWSHTTGAFTTTTDWSRDGRFLAFTHAGPKTGADLWILSLSGERKAAPYLQTPFEEMDGQFSPDGRWMTYTSNETERFEVYVQPIPASGGKWQISTGGGRQPRWRRDGKEIFYIAPDGKLMAVPVKAVPPGSLERGVPQALFEARFLVTGTRRLTRTYDPSADGRRFLITTQVGETAVLPITVVVNWR